MEKYPMNRAYGRSCQTAGGINHTQIKEPGRSRQTIRADYDYEESCACRMPGMSSASTALYRQVDSMPVAMAYVPCQKFTECFDQCRALRAGTIFPDLCKPFCGKRGAKR